MMSLKYNAYFQQERVFKKLQKHMVVAEGDIQHIALMHTKERNT
jgi:hypothetical protein